MAEHGGYRRPANPAPVSGPGALARRTDGGPTQAPMLATGGAYGDRKDMQDIQSSAPLAGGGEAPTPATPAVTRDMLTPLDAPSDRPEEPITTGMGNAVGENPSQIDDVTRERIQGSLPMLAWLASQPKASEQTRQFVRQLQADL